MGLETLSKAGNIPVPAQVATFESVISTGRDAIKNIIMLNGGAVVALLAFVGATWNKSASLPITKTLLTSMVLFDAGILLSSVASGFSYLGQRAYKKNKTRGGDVYVRLTIFLVVFAHILFIGASGVAVYGFWSGQLSPEYQPTANTHKWQSATVIGQPPEGFVLVEDNSTKQSDFAAWQEENKKLDLVGKIDDLESKVRNHVEQLELKVSSLESMVSNLESTVSKSKSKVRDLEFTVSNLDYDIEKLKKQIKQRVE